MEPRRGVIFDMDGVLVDSADAHRRAWQKLGDEVGVPYTDDLFRRTFGQRNSSIIPTWLGETSARRIDELGARKEEIYRELVRRGAVRIYDRVPALLHELRKAGAALAVASSGPRENVALLIEVIGVTALIRAAISADDVTEGKPHPAPFLKAAEKLDLPPPLCAVVEDSVHGIEAAKRAGMLAVAVLTSTPRSELQRAGADLFAGEAGALTVAALLGASPS
jgi:beta-phosphoglucomutase